MRSLINAVCAYVINMSIGLQGYLSVNIPLIPDQASEVPYPGDPYALSFVVSNPQQIILKHFDRSSVSDGAVPILPVSTISNIRRTSALACAEGYLRF